MEMEEIDTTRVVPKGLETDAVAMTAKLVKEAREEALSRYKAIE